LLFFFLKHHDLPSLPHRSRWMKILFLFLSETAAISDFFSSLSPSERYRDGGGFPSPHVLILFSAEEEEEAPSGHFFFFLFLARKKGFLIHPLTFPPPYIVGVSFFPLTLFDPRRGKRLRLFLSPPRVPSISWMIRLVRS